MRKLMVAFVAAALVIALPLPVRAAEGIEFLDMRPVVIDLDTSPTGQRWRVPVLDGRPGSGHAAFLTLSFRPADALRVVRPTLTLQEGEVADFVVELRRPVPGSGELLLSSGGTIVRRAISTTNRAGRAGVPVSRLQFTGVRLTPFSDRVRTGSVTVPGALGGGGTGGRIGLLTSGRGDSAEVIRRGDTFSVQGATRVGEYQGTMDLLPGQTGGEADVALRVRDLPVWPLLVLILGLVVVQLLDRYQNRRRPRQLFHLRLARLRDRAQAAQRELHLTYRIAAQPGEPGLLLDREVAEAQARYDEQVTDAERAMWDAEGTEYRKIAGLVESFETLAQTIGTLTRERSAEQDDEPAARALDSSPVGRALRGRALRSAVDLADATAEVDAARSYLREFRRLYRLAGQVGASAARAKLLAGPENLTGLAAEIDELYRAWQPGPVVAPPYVEPPQFDGYPQVQPQGYRAPPGGSRRRLWPVLAAAAAVLLAVPCLLIVFTTADGPNPGVVPTPSTAGPVPSPTASRLPEIPASPPAQPPPPREFGPAEPTTGQLVLYGGVLPVLLAAAVAAVAWRARRWWRPRRTALDSAALDRQVRLADRQFAVVGGVLVVLGGMSVLYFGRPAFGTAGDYLAIALWATAFGEGLNLARRLWPQPVGG